MKTKNLPLPVAILCSLMAAATVKAQKPVVIRGGEFCERYLLKRVAEEKAKGVRIVKLKNFNADDETLSPTLKKWLQFMRKGDLLTAEVRNKERKALILSSTSYEAAGLATNLENWHIEIDNIHSITFWSFSKNPKLIFWDKNGLLNYYSVVYSREWIENKDWENLTVNLERYQINPDGSGRLVSAQNYVKCE